MKAACRIDARGKATEKHADRKLTQYNTVISNAYSYVNTSNNLLGVSLDYLGVVVKQSVQVHRIVRVPKEVDEFCS